MSKEKCKTCGGRGKYHNCDTWGCSSIEHINKTEPCPACKGTVAELKIKDIIDALTNGLGDKPYYRRVNEEIKVFVADDQEVCTMNLMPDSIGEDENIAKAICEAGLLIAQLQEENEKIKAERAKSQFWVNYHNLSVSFLKLQKQVEGLKCDLAIIHEHTNLADSNDKESFVGANKMIRNRTKKYANLELTAGPISKECPPKTAKRIKQALTEQAKEKANE